MDPLRTLWRVKELYEEESGAYHEPIRDLQWGYLHPREPTLEELARRSTAMNLRTNRLLSSFGELRDDGTTTSGNWLYSGSFTEEGNMMARRGTSDPAGLGFQSRLGVQLAGEPTCSVQPCLGRPGRRAVGPIPSGDPLDRAKLDR